MTEFCCGCLDAVITYLGGAMVMDYDAFMSWSCVLNNAFLTILAFWVILILYLIINLFFIKVLI